MRVETEGLSWSVHRTPILSDVNVRAVEGRLTGVIGPNGSGKTTLLHLMAGLRAPSAGTVTVDGRELRTLSTRQRAREIAVVEQHATTNLDLSVRQVVDLGRIPHRGRWPGAAAKDAGRVEEAMRASRVEHLAERRWPTLSGGERQRVQLARALAQEPRLLVLDEPTNHLDLGRQIEFFTLVRETGVTAVAALHELDFAAAYCHDLIVLQGGRVVAQGPTREVLTEERIARVYEVEARVGGHPALSREHVLWSGLL